MGFQPIKWINPLDGSDPIWTLGGGNKSITDQIFSIKGIAIAGIIVYGLTELKGGK